MRAGMALIVCIECGAEVSDKAKACPKCGFPINSEQENNIVTVKEKKTIDKDKLKKTILIVAAVIIVILIGKGFVHPNLKFEDLVFGDARASALLGYASGHDKNGKYWDNSVKLYGLKVDHLEYHDGWYLFYFSKDKGNEARQIVYDYCNRTIVSRLYHDESGKLAVWWDGEQEYGKYKGYYRIKVTKS